MIAMRTPPPTASVATPDETGKLVAPAAARNMADISDVLGKLAPASGQALEIASGTGQHIAHFATRFPDLTWQPTDIDPTRITSIAAYGAEAELPNLRPPVLLDATAAGWGTLHAGQDLIFVVNLLHLISAPEAEILITEAATALAPNGVLMIYGPFLRNGVFTSTGDEAFHTTLATQDPEIGYKNDEDVMALLTASRCTPNDPIEMPANNLVLSATKPKV
jgi:SAM-dependent methyltransferase